jgi:hypothetical protein
MPRLGRQRDAGGAGFGNARAVRNLYEQSIARQSARVLAERREGGAPDPLLLRRDDLLGPKRLDAGGSKALQELEAMRGLRRVKESVQTLLGLIECAGCGSTGLVCRHRERDAFVWLQAKSHILLCVIALAAIPAPLALLRLRGPVRIASSV